MSLVPGYGSDSDDGKPDEEEEDPWGEVAPLPAGAVITRHQEDTDSESSSEEEEEEDEEEAAAPAPSLLPPPDEAFASVEGPPSFLSPEATKQLNVAPGVALGAGEEEEDDGPVDRSAAKGSAVMVSAAVTYDPDARGGQGEQSELQAHLAAHGGGLVGKVRPPKKDESKRKGGAVGAMGVDELMANGGALPRKKQDRKEREEKKRKLGQSAHSEWKSEAEMAMRQQYD